MPKEILSIVDQKVSHRHPSRSASVRFAAGFAGAAGVLTTGLGLIGCGGETGGQVAEPTRFSEVLPTSEAPDTPTLIPAVRVTPEPTVAVVSEITRDQLMQAINDALPFVSDSIDAHNIQYAISDGFNSIDDVNEKGVTAVNPPSFFGDAYKLLGKYACEFHNDKLINARRKTLDFTIQYIDEMQIAGKLDSDLKERFMSQLFATPAAC